MASRRKTKASASRPAATALASPPQTPVTVDATAVVPTEPSAWPSMLMSGFILTMVAAFIFFSRHFGAIAGNELVGQKALFTVVNVGTLTGFIQPRDVHDLTRGGQAVALLLIFSGILFSFIGGGLAVVRIARLPYSSTTVIAWALFVPLVVACGGAVFLRQAGRTSFDGMFLAVSALGNCGTCSQAPPGTGDFITHLVVLPLAVLGGLGLPVLMELGHLITGKARSLTLHSRTLLIWSAGIYLAGTVALFIAEPGGSEAGAFRHRLVLASSQALNTRSLGLSFQSLSDTPIPCMGLLLLLMMIGAAPAGTGGGIKVTTLAALFRGAGYNLRAKPVGKWFRYALIWVGMYCAAWAMITVAMVIMVPELRFGDLLFLAGSAISNTGLSHNPVDGSRAELFILTLAMLAGRLGPVWMLWHLAERVPETEIATA